MLKIIILHAFDLSASITAVGKERLTDATRTQNTDYLKIYKN